MIQTAIKTIEATENFTLETAIGVRTCVLNARTDGVSITVTVGAENFTISAGRSKDFWFDISGDVHYVEGNVENPSEVLDLIAIEEPIHYYYGLAQTSRAWRKMATLGTNVYACVYGGDIYMQTAGAGDFVALSQTSRNWTGICAVGSDVYACVYGGDIYVQLDGSGDFVALSQTSRNWSGICAVGSDVYACVYGGDIYKQTAGAGDFVALSQTSRNWSDVTTLGTNVYACVYGGDIYMQTAGAGDFVALSQTSRNYESMTSNDNNVYCAVYGGYVYKQTAGSGTFTQISNVTKNWKGMTSLNDVIYGAVDSGDIYSANIASAIEIYSESECLTNRKFLGLPVYRKVVNFGVLPNATSKTVAHGITGTFSIIDFEIITASNTGASRKLPDPAVTSIIIVAGATINITTPSESSNIRTYVTIEYVKATL